MIFQCKYRSQRHNFYTSSRVVAKGGVEGGSTDGQWKEFTITLDYGDAEFDINQKYRFAIVCSSSKEGDKFWGAQRVNYG